MGKLAAMRAVIVRTGKVLGLECLFAGAVALISPETLSEYALWFIGVGAALLLPTLFWEEFKIVRRSELGAASSMPGASGPTECMPLYRAFRWLVQDSKWAATYRPGDDDQWVSRGNREIQSALSMGRLRSWGFHKPHMQPADHGISEIPADFWRKAQWNSHRIVTDEPPTHIWRNGVDGGGQYRRVVLDGAAVRAAWSRRSFWEEWKGKSPVERLSRRHSDGGYAAIWQRQDDYYRKLERSEPYGTFDALFESETPSIIEVQEPDLDPPIAR